MSKIAPCPFCGGECVQRLDGPGYNWVECWTITNGGCGYQSAEHDDTAIAIRDHNRVARRLDPGRILRALGGMRGWHEKQETVLRRYFRRSSANAHLEASAALSTAIEKIRAMKDRK